VTAAGNGRAIRVLIVDDSVVIRRLVGLALGEDPAFEVVGVAANGSIALRKIVELKPDAVTLDIEMPEMDGLETLRRIRREFPKLRVVMFSTLTQRGAAHTLEALSLGADDYVTKAANVGSLDTSLRALREELGPKIKQFFGRPAPVSAQTPAAPPIPKPSPATGPAPKRARRPAIVAVAVSTGGPNALADIFPLFPGDLPCPMVVTQHMPPMFTRLLAERLNAKSALRVAEAEEGMALEPGLALIAPGDFHLKLRRAGGRVEATLDRGAPENSCRPAADVMFRSVLDVYGGDAVCVVLTGMGKDGLEGARLLREAGAPVVAQDEATSVVWGMPGHVVQAGLAESVVPLERVPAAVLRLLGRS
jgi:two-component system, chemotaxis family, protein-glutamate methylesterase/glutaminase